MASIAISELENESTQLKDNDLILVSNNNGNGSYTSMRMTGESLKNSVTNISKLDSCDNLSENDYLLVSKATTNEEGEITSRSNQKLVGDYISRLINKKFQTIVSSITSLRKTIDDITDITSGGTITTGNFCILDGNLGILGTDIPSYNNIKKWEIKFRFTQLDESKCRKANGSDPAKTDYTCFYNYAITDNSAYKAGVANNGTTRWDNDRVVGMSWTVRNNDTCFASLFNSCKFTQRYPLNICSGVRYWNNKTISEIFETDHILTINMISGSIDISLGDTSSTGGILQLQLDVRDNYEDHFLSDGNWTNGLYGRLYYIKGYSDADVELCNLTPVAKNSFVLLHDSVNDSYINFRGVGSATLVSVT